MPEYHKQRCLSHMPRIPLHGNLDLTYRCNNNCRHCWLRIPPTPPKKQRELTLDEIKAIVDQARKMGCKKWNISGGEPMLRPDFPDIFDYITSKSVSYSINTNGTMITPEIAELMKRKGKKMVALYGATADVHDHITRNAGSFQATMKGFQLLQESGAEFIVQLIPMRDNYHQFSEMVRLAKTLSAHWRVGAAWLYFTASGDSKRNAEIERQRLDPREVVKLNKPDLSYEEDMESEREHVFGPPKDDRLFASCIAGRREFHIDPYGRMGFCGFIKDPQLLYDLGKGSFDEAWEKFVPSLADRIRYGEEYQENCGSCSHRQDCSWCPVYGYLEHGRFSAPVEYLCQVTKENRKFEKNWNINHRRYFKCGGITIKVDSDLPIEGGFFHPTINLFQSDRPGEEMITVIYHAYLPHLDGKDLGEIVFQRGGWVVHRKGNSWIYLSSSKDSGILRIVVFNQDHTKVSIYDSSDKNGYKDLFPLYRDQIFLTQTALAQVLAERGGCILHSSGVIIGGKGVLFVGHSGAGKSTLRKMILSRVGVEPLCDDRNVIRRWPDGYWVHGTWANKELSDVSVATVPLSGIMFLEQAKENRIIPLDIRMEVIKRLLPRVIRPVESKEWWNRSLTLIEEMSRDIPCYCLRFDLSGDIMGMVEDICG